MQLRRLDPMANAGPYQRLVRNPVKSFTLTEVQYQRIADRRPQLIIAEGDAAVIGRPYRDFLELHYAFPDVESFKDRFTEMVLRCLAAASPEEAPRGALLSFRDRPNRPLAETIFWSLLLQEGPQWVEMNQVAVPEQPEPEGAIEGGFNLVEATLPQHQELAEIESTTSGLPPLTLGGVASLVENARCLRLVKDPSGANVGFLSLRTEPGGWGVIEALSLLAEHSSLREPLLRWSIAWLRNNGGRRIRRQAYLDDPELAQLRDLGFAPGETGLDYYGSLDADERARKEEERRAHGSMIKFGNWR
jgi:hypothetical protein